MTWDLFQISGSLWMWRQVLKSCNSHFSTSGPKFFSYSVAILSRPIIVFSGWILAIPASIFFTVKCLVKPESLLYFLWSSLILCFCHFYFEAVGRQPGLCYFGLLSPWSLRAVDSMRAWEVLLLFWEIIFITLSPFGCCVLREGASFIHGDILLVPPAHF